MFCVIIPLYNKSAYIEKCLQSVFAQTFRDFEVVLVNDGSADDGPEKAKNIISEFARQHLTDIHDYLPAMQIINQLNSGVSNARNNGVKAAKHEYIAFLDADDWWEPNFLEEMKCLVLAFPNAGIYGSGYYTVKNGRKRMEPIGVDQSIEKGIINYFRAYSKTLSMPLTSSSIVVRKTIFESENGFNPALKLGEDFDFWVRIALKYPVAFLNKALSNYNQDVDAANRAVANLNKPDCHMLWNLEYLAGEELTNPDLKLLLDKLRLYILFPYYISTEYHLQAKRELAKVDWHLHSPANRLKYSFPIWILKIWDKFMVMGSGVKQKLIRLAIKYKQ